MPLASGQPLYYSTIVSRRREIELTVEEQHEFLGTAKTIILSSVDRRGYPHSVPMWFIVDETGSVLMTTYGKSQKIVNLRRNPKCSLLVESGTAYHELKGVLIRGCAEVTEDQAVTLETLVKIHRKYYGDLASGVDDAMRAQARKRVTIRIKPERVSSWDHSKLAGRY